MSNFRSLATAMLFGASALISMSPANAAAACRDSHGRFAKCPSANVKRSPALTKAKAAAPHSSLASVGAAKTPAVRAVAKTSTKSAMTVRTAG